MKRCELCKSVARIYCDSDQASLCWACDAKVHSANFLVARHSRSLLCHACQSPTPWSASGGKLGPTVSVCERCIADGGSDEKDDDRVESEGGNDDEFETDDDEYDDDDDEDDEEEIDLDDEDGDNQVVPWSSTPPPAASSSSSEDSSNRFCNGNIDVSLKRMRQNCTDLCSEDDDLDCSTSRRSRRTLSPATASNPGGGAAFAGSLAARPLKIRRSESNDQLTGLADPRSDSTVGTVKIFYQEGIAAGEDASAPVVGMCKASRAVDFDLSGSM